MFANNSTLPLRSTCQRVASTIFRGIGSVVARGRRRPPGEASPRTSAGGKPRAAVVFDIPDIVERRWRHATATDDRKTIVAYVFTGIVAEDGFHIDEIGSEIDKGRSRVDIRGVEFDDAVKRRAEVGCGGDIADGSLLGAKLGAENARRVDRNEAANAVGGIGGDVAIVGGGKDFGGDRDVAAGEITAGIGFDEATAPQDDIWGIEPDATARVRGCSW